jgi:anti-sigma factor RsiW
MMMHCTMDDLTALRAGEASVWARQHITTCETCQRELETLYQRVAQLKALPARRPARDRWPAIRDQVRAERARRRRRWSTWGGSLAAAAALAGVLLVRPSGGQGGSLHAELSQAKQQSATLEDSLQRYDIDGRVLSGHAAAVVAELEDRISAIDGTLARREPGTQDAQLVKLWQDRVDLMRELVNARATRARYVGL